MIKLTPQDHALIQLLRQNARASVTDLAQALNLSRTTVKQRLQRLEEKAVIKGYTVRLSSIAKAHSIYAHVLVKIDHPNTAMICDALADIRQVETVLSVSGRYDLIVLLHASDTEQLDTILDTMLAIEGVAATESSVVLSTRLDRR